MRLERLPAAHHIRLPGNRPARSHAPRDRACRRRALLVLNVDDSGDGDRRRRNRHAARRDYIHDLAGRVELNICSAVIAAQLRGCRADAGD